MLIPARWLLNLIGVVIFLYRFITQTKPDIAD
jgi:hypothetical protein